MIDTGRFKTIFLPPIYIFSVTRKFLGHNCFVIQIFRIILQLDEFLIINET